MVEFAGVGSATKRATPSSSKIGIIHNFFCVFFQPFPGLAFLNIQGYIHGGRDKVSSNIPPPSPPSLPPYAPPTPTHPPPRSEEDWDCRQDYQEP